MERYYRNRSFLKKGTTSSFFNLFEDDSTSWNFKFDFVSFLLNYNFLTFKFYFDSFQNKIEFEKVSTDLQNIYNYNSYLNFFVNKPNSLLNDLEIKIFDLTSTDSIRNLLTHSFSPIMMFQALFLSSNSSSVNVLNEYWKWLTFFYNMNSTTDHLFFKIYNSYHNIKKINYFLTDHFKQSDFVIDTFSNPLFYFNYFLYPSFNLSHYVNIILNSSFLFNRNHLYLNAAGLFLKTHLHKYSNISFFKNVSINNSFLNPHLSGTSKLYFLEKKNSSSSIRSKQNLKNNQNSSFDFSKNYFIFYNYNSFDLIRKVPWKFIKLRFKSKHILKKKKSHHHRIIKLFVQKIRSYKKGILNEMKKRNPEKYIESLASKKKYKPKIKLSTRFKKLKALQMKKKQLILDKKKKKVPFFKYKLFKYKPNRLRYTIDIMFNKYVQSFNSIKFLYLKPVNYISISKKSDLINKLSTFNLSSQLKKKLSLIQQKLEKKNKFNLNHFKTELLSIYLHNIHYTNKYIENFVQVLIFKPMKIFLIILCLFVKKS